MIVTDEIRNLADMILQHNGLDTRFIDDFSTLELLVDDGYISIIDGKVFATQRLTELW